MCLKSKIKKSLAGTEKQYHVVEGAEGFRLRSMKVDGNPELFRIHVEENAPEIDSRNRLDKSDYKVTYWAFDIRVDSIQEAIRLALKGAGINPFQAILDNLDEQIVEAQKEAEAAKAKEGEILAQRALMAKAKEIYDTLAV